MPRTPARAPKGFCGWCREPITAKRRLTFCKARCAERWWSFWWGSGRDHPPPGYAIVVFTRDQFRCQLCGYEPDWSKWVMVQVEHWTEEKRWGHGLQVDHIIPVSRGGEHKLANMQTLCRRCNLGKGDRLDWRPKVAPEPKAPKSLGPVYQGVLL